MAARAPVQAKSSTPSSGGDARVQAVATAGVQGAGGPLPYLSRIQRSFGRHDVSGVQAYTGSKAASASQAIGATAYTMGNKVAFGDARPSLHTVAHEAAHTIQQRAGVQLLGGIGRPGDRYERHADAVADKVVQGRSAEAELSRLSTDSPRSGAVQREALQLKVDYEQTKTTNGYWPAQVTDGWWCFVVNTGNWDWTNYFNPSIAQYHMDEPEERKTLVKLKLSAHPHITGALRRNFSTTNRAQNNDIKQVRAMRLSNGEGFHLVTRLGHVNDPAVTVGLLGEHVLSLDFRPNRSRRASELKRVLKPLTGTEEYTQNDVRHMGTHYLWPGRMGHIHYHLCGQGGLPIDDSASNEVAEVVREGMRRRR